MSELLKGIRVIENASVITGPLAGSILADLGADVLKVENPDGGDQFRKWDGNEKNVNVGFAVYNHGKRSITINLRSEAGRDVYRNLVRDADVVIENFRPGTMDERGVGYERLSEINPSLIYCEITGVGATGPYRGRPTFDAVAQALSGLWSGFIDVDKPEPLGPPMSDTLTGIYSALAIMSAVISRASTGTGTKLSVNMLSSSIAFNALAVAGYLDSKAKNIEFTLTKSSRAQGSQTYAFVDISGKPFAVHLSTPKKFWVGLCETVGHAEMIDDDRYNTKSKRVQRYTEIHDTFSAVFVTRDRESWLKALIAADVPCAPILSVGEALEDPQVMQLNMLWRDPTAGYSLVRSPVQQHGEFAVGALPAPMLGEHTAEVLATLGYGAGAIGELRSSGAV